MSQHHHQENRDFCVMEVFNLYLHVPERDQTFNRSSLPYKHSTKIPMCISVKSPLCFSRQSLGLAVRIQWKDSEGSGWESCCWKDHVSPPSLFLGGVFSSENAPASPPVLIVFLFSGWRVMERMKRSPGMQRAAGGVFLALVSGGRGAF